MLAIVDTETTGLPRSRVSDGSDDFSEVRATEVAILLLTDRYEETSRHVFKFRLSDEMYNNASPDMKKALEINGYDHSLEGPWGKAPIMGTPQAANQWRNIAVLLRKRTLVAQNVAFDAGVLKAELLRYQLCTEVSFPWTRRVFDVLGLCQFLRLHYDIRNAKGWSSASIQDVYPAMGGPEMEAHRAMADAERIIYILKVFNDTFTTADEVYSVKEQRRSDPELG